MRAAFIAFVAVSAASALRTGAALAGEAGGEPSIEEMLSAIEAARGDGASAPPRPAAEPGPSERTVSERAHKPAARPAPDFAQEARAMRARADARARYYRKQNLVGRLAGAYMNFEVYRQAERVLADALRRNAFNANISTVADAHRLVPGTWNDRQLALFGHFEIMHARCLVRLGAKEAASARLAEAQAVQVVPQRKRAQAAKWVPKNLPRFKQDLEKAREFVAGYEGAEAELEALTASLAEEPSGERQWRLVELCRPGANRADKPLKWIEGLLAMRAQYPDHPKVRDGLALWELFRAYRAFEMHEKGVEVLDEIMEKHPRLRLNAPGRNVWAPDVLWEKAESYVRLGLMREELGGRGARAAYVKASETFELFRKTYPDHGRSQPFRHKKRDVMMPAMVDSRLAAVQAAIGRTK